MQQGSDIRIAPPAATAVKTLPRMLAAHFAPSEALRPFVRSYLLVDSPGGTVNRLLPDTAATLAFRLHGSSEDRTSSSGPLPAVAITGITRSARLLAYEPGTSNFLVLFREGVASVFFGDLHNLKGSTAPLHELLPHHVLARVEDALHEAPDDQARIEAVERFLLAHLMPRRTDAMVHEAMRRIRSAQGILRIGTLAADLGISLDAFEKRFRAVTTASPKHFASIVRFRSLLEKHKDASDPLSMAYDGAFHDQSHFNAAFKQFTGLTPRKFFAQGEYW